MCVCDKSHNHCGMMWFREKGCEWGRSTGAPPRRGPTLTATAPPVACVGGCLLPLGTSCGLLYLSVALPTDLGRIIDTPQFKFQARRPNDFTHQYHRQHKQQTRKTLQDAFFFETRIDLRKPCWPRTAIRRIWCIVTRFRRSSNPRLRALDIPRHRSSWVKTMRMPRLPLPVRPASAVQDLQEMIRS